ncbi:non-ribosomal peptide synthetase [Xanthomonas theicola]|uniref:non-ribosomal peptide synthetase n=1 Tax=Xanthomonas theicola TaxID=56464 RepID=UPI001304F246|nr:non-ribosomal peptide synthetase [Xanthomonas theicola]QNH25425.1 amino acid adenylation domain-containing protein [Xanthomonas theicola]
MSKDVLDFVGVGFGPSNLSLAVAAKEIDPKKRGLFFERRASFDWHPGMLFDSSRMQISFLKDLATLRNPASPFSFLRYTQAKGRLEHFVNLGNFHPTRWEYRDYLRWVAAAFADQVRYGAAVRRVTPRADLFEVEVEDLATGMSSHSLTRNVVYAAGGKPRYPSITGSNTENVIHSNDFLHRFPQRFPDSEGSYCFGVVGDGQSAGEIVLYLLQRYPRAQVHAYLNGYAMRPVDRSPFVNEAFMFSEMEAFHDASDDKRAVLRQELRSTNYGVVAPELIDAIYDCDYMDRVKGERRLTFHRFATLVALDADDRRVLVTSRDRHGPESKETSFDGFVLATGYERTLDSEIFGAVLPFVQRGASGAPSLTKHYRVQTQPEVLAGLYVQGYGEGSHGLGDTLLSLLPFRSRDIFNDMFRSSTYPLPMQRMKDGQYPPKRHLENDPEKLYAVLEHCRFATLISADQDEPIVTHVPLILDRTKGAKGVLFGHMDRANPHLDVLAGKPVLAVFHGPNAYISPRVYSTEQLPTWNSISVHVRGRVRLVETREGLLRGLESIAETDTRPDAYRLDVGLPVVDRILPYIVGLELEIDELVGRFKLSQDRNATDQRLAAIELARRSEAGDRALVEKALGCALEARVIHERFEAQVTRMPNALAVRFEGESVSYAALNARANQLAHHLRGLGAGPEVVVGLCMERSANALVGLLGILKAGAAYVPLDPEHPPQRIQMMLQDTAATLVVTEQRFVDRLPAGLARSICLDGDWPAIAESSLDNPRSGVDPRNLAYVMFTSGSTGKPKAVTVAHDGLVNHALHMQRALRMTAADRMLQILPLNGDGSVEEILVPLITGAALFPLAEKLPSARDFVRFLIHQRITVINITTAYWHFWVGDMSQRPPEEWPQTLRLVMMGGEAVSLEKFRQWRQIDATRNVQWMQEYGPTEATISCTVYAAPPMSRPEDLSIGRPISNMYVHLLDEQGLPVAAGEVGELCIAGVGLARGYLGQPALTAEKFVPHPYGAPGSRLYKTGDFARVLADGNIQFLGRRDRQVKILGHRIELGEVERALERHPHVREAVVVVYESATEGTRLAAYVVANDFVESHLREHLARILPRQMMPASITALATLPINANGKVDRARLPAPELVTPGIAHADELEQTVARFWTQDTGRVPQSVDEDFFLVGGDSLRALRLLSRLSSLTGVELNVTAFFRDRTIRGLTQALRAGSPVAGGLAPKLTRVASSRRFASNAQQRLWFLDKLQHCAAYSVPLAYHLKGPFSVERLDRCMTEIVARHEALRTALVATDHTELWQEIAAPMEIRSRRLSANSLAEALAVANAEASVPFDLTAAPLVRSLCIHIAEDQALWFVNFHHAMWDAWSLAVVWRELMALYAGAEPLPPPAFQYADYAQWQRAWLSSAAADVQRAFWRQELAGELPLLQLGRRGGPQAEQTTRGAMELCPFDAVSTHATRQAAERHGTTEYVILLSAFLATLHRYTRQDQLVIGVPVACRSLPETEGVVGFFANTLPLRMTFTSQMRFSDLVEQTAERLAAALAHQELPFDEIVEAQGDCAREGSRNPLFQAMFVMQTIPLDETQRLGAASVEEVIVHSGTSKVDVTCSIRSGAQGLRGELEYSTDRLSEGEAQRFVAAFLNVVTAATQAPSTPLDALPMATRAECDALIRRSNSGFARYPDLQPAHVRFEAQARRTPDEIAIQTTSAAVSYRALNARANRLARRLVAAGVGVESLVGISVERSVEMVTAILAVLKAGAGFVPLDPHFPSERVRTIAADARLKMLLTAQELAEPLDGDDTNLDVPVAAQNIAYVYYTSGSTGAPKGVVLEHRGVMNRLEWLRRRYPLAVGDRVVLKTPLIFDLSIWEIFGPLMAGATILMADARAESDVMHLGELLAAPGTAFAYFVPSMLDAYLSYAPPRVYPDLQWLAVTGEAMPARLLERFKQHFTQSEFHSTYGQTETAEVALWTGSEWSESATVPVGRPNGIYRLFVLDAALNPVPPYVPGEICVAGIDGLARGYQNRPALTAERFVAHPYALEPGERLYRTGDLGRFLEDGQIEYVGRIDTQVKIRGCRVEIAEIEAVLSRHSTVRLCAVSVRTDTSGGAELLAYVVSDSRSAQDLAAHAESVLPHYMLPAAYIFMDDLPLTPSGKLDRQRLPAPSKSDFTARSTYEAPRSELEVELAALWAKVLKLERVGRSDNFFNLGGNSLKSVQVLMRIKDAYQVAVQVRDFFGAPTVAGLAAIVEQAVLAYVDSLSAEEIDATLALPV